MSESTSITLAPLHETWLSKESAILPEVSARAGLYSLDDAKAASKLFGRPEKEWKEHLPVLIFPYRLPGQRDPVLYRGRPTKGFETPKGDGSFTVAKYVQPPKTGVHIYFGPSVLDERTLNDAKIPLWITEGERKTLSAESHGLSCVGIPGVSQWHKKGDTTLHPYFSHIELTGREVFVCFDYDALTNKDVRREELALGRALEKKGALVRIVRLPQDAPKLDDFFATHEASELAALIEDARQGGKLPPDTSGPSEADWADLWPKLRIDWKTQRPIADADNIARILIHHPAWDEVLVYDSRFDCQRFAKEPPFDDDLKEKNAPIPRKLVDADATRIGAWLASQRVLGWQKKPSVSVIEEAITVACNHRKYDGVQRYLSSLKWDGVARLDSTAHRYFGASDTDYHRTVVAKWMLSAVARARTPGCQADYVLVLEGLQGKVKSTALRTLVGEEWFADSLPDITTKDAHDYCVGPWVIELAELEHVRGSAITALKAFITMRAGRFRQAYGRRTGDFPRRCVFAGTTNDETYLNDPTGNRRFWPVKTGEIDIAAIREDRDQLWAEAVHRVRAGEPIWLDDAMESEAKREQKARRIADPWTEKLGGLIAAKPRVTVSEALGLLGVPTERHDQRGANRVANILREAGWTRVRARFGSMRVWVYEAPVVLGGPSSGSGASSGQVIDFPSYSSKVPVVPLKEIEDREEDGGGQAVEGGARVRANRVHVRSQDLVGPTGTQAPPDDSIETAPAPGEHLW